MKAPSNGYLPQPQDGERKSINSELWHACAGPLVSLPPVGSLVVYFPQGHSEQVAASMQKETDGHIPNYPSLPSKLICQLHNVTLHADVETDEVYAQMTLQPVNTDKEALLPSDLGLKQSKQPTEFFCKTLTASDTSTHGGFSVPRRAAEKIFPALDFAMQPPAQELMARDLHDHAWTFRHIYRGQPKRHLLTTGWSVFVSAKRLFAGDSVLFIRDEKSQLLLGIRRANRQQAAMSSSVLSSDSMHIGVLAAAAHASSNHSRFTVFYNPRASPSEFVIPLSKYNKAIYAQVSLGMRFRMMFETEESGVRRYMGTITGISDLDPVKWPNSQWRNIQVGWDESSAGERQNRVSIWEIEPVATPFFICPPPFFRPKRPRQPGMLGEESEIESAIKRSLPWFGEETGIGNSQNPTMPGGGLLQWMNMQQRPDIMSSAIQSDFYRPMAAATLQKLGSNDITKPLNSPQQALQSHQLQFGIPQSQQPELHQPQIMWPQQQHHLSNQQQQQQHLYTQQQMPPQQLDQHHLHMQQQIPSQQVEQHHVLSQKVTQQHQSLQQLQLQPAQQLQQRLHQFQSQPQPQLQQQPQLLALPQSQPQPQLQQQPQLLTQSQSQPQSQPKPQPQLQPQPQVQPAQQQHQRLQQLQQQPGQLLQQQPAQMLLQQPGQLLQQQPAQQLQQQPAQLQQNPQRLQQQSQQVQQQHSLPASQQFHSHQTQLLAPSQQHVHNQYPQFLHSQHLQQSIQLPELRGQLLQSTSGRSQAAVNMPLLTKAQSGFTEADAPSCSTSTSANSYPLQNTLTRANQSAVMNDEKPQCANMPRPSASSTQAALPACNFLGDPQVASLLPSIKEPNQAALQTYLSVQMGQMEASSSSGTSYSLTPDAAISQSLPLLPLQSSPFLFRDVSHDNDVQTDPRRNMLPTFSNGKDIQAQVSTTISSQTFSVPDLPLNSGVTSDLGIGDSSILQRGGSWQQPPPPVRTYTKVYKLGSVGRSIDVTRCKNYDELRRELACMFGLEGQLEDPHRSGWQLVFVDNENDVLLVGDDPWEEFVSCVRCIRILSPSEVLQMSQEGMLLNPLPLQQQAGSSSDGGIVWRDHCDQNSTNPSVGSFEH